MNIKIFIYLFLIINSFSRLHAQIDSWEVSIDNKVLLNGSAQDSAENMIYIKKVLFSQSKKIYIHFKSNINTMWKRKVWIDDETGKTRKSYFPPSPNQTIAIPTKEIKRIAKNSKTISIWSTLSPLNNDILIRIRRVLLCKIVLQ